MRNFIDIVETASEPNEGLLDILEDWMHNFSADESYSNALNQKCEDIIELARDYPVTYQGMLYRGTAILDEHALALQKGETVIIPPLPKKLASWTKSFDTALDFAEFQVEGRLASAVVVAMPAPNLRTVVDLDLLYDSRPHTEHESEVLVHNDPLKLSRANVKHLWVYNPDTEESVQIY